MLFLCTLVLTCVGRGDALVETMTFNRRVVGSTPSLAATYIIIGILGKSFTIQLPVRFGVKLGYSISVL